MSKFWLIVSAILMVVYVAYVVWAKFTLVLGAPPWHLGELGEFILFSSSVIAFVVQVFSEGARNGEAADAQRDHA